MIAVIIPHSRSRSLFRIRPFPLVLLAALFGAALPACSRTSGIQPSTRNVAPLPRWAPLLEPTPDLLIVVHPRAIRRDRSFGPLVGRAIDLAREHARWVTLTASLQAIEDAEEVIVAARDGAEGKSDLVMVVEGVRADIDPAGLVDDRGRSLWASSSTEPGEDVRELRSRPDVAKGDKGTLPAGASTDAPAGAFGADDGSNASLFELPGRTWVIGVGEAQERARGVLASRRPGGGSDLVGGLFDGCPLGGERGSRLAAVRLSGPALMRHVPALHPPGLLSPVARELVSVTIVLSSEENGDQGVIRAALSYEGQEVVAPAEVTLKEALAAFLASKGGKGANGADGPDLKDAGMHEEDSPKKEDQGWLCSPVVLRAQSCVLVTMGCR